MNGQGDPTTTARQRAASLIAIGRADEAIRLLGVALASSPDNVGLHCELARGLIEVGRFPEALDQANRAIGLSPSDEWPHRLASSALSKMGGHGDAVLAATTSVRLAPGSALSHRNRGFVLYNAGRLVEAGGEADWLCANQPDEPDSWRLQALIAIRRRRLDEAEAMARRGLAASPDNVALTHLMGTIEARRGRRQSAGVHFLAAQRLDPSGRSSRDALVAALAYEPASGAPAVLAVACAAAFVEIGYPVLAIRLATVPITAALIGAMFAARRWQAARHPDVAEARATARRVAPRRLRAAQPVMLSVLVAEAIAILVLAPTNSGRGFAFMAGGFCLLNGGSAIIWLVSRPSGSGQAGPPIVRLLGLPVLRTELKPVVPGVSRPGSTEKVRRWTWPSSSIVRFAFVMFAAVLIFFSHSDKTTGNPAEIDRTQQYPVFKTQFTIPPSCAVQASVQHSSLATALAVWHQEEPHTLPTEAALARMINYPRGWSLYHLSSTGQIIVSPTASC